MAPGLTSPVSGRCVGHWRSHSERTERNASAAAVPLFVSQSSSAILSIQSASANVAAVDFSSGEFGLRVGLDSTGSAIMTDTTADYTFLRVANGSRLLQLDNVALISLSAGALTAKSLTVASADSDLAVLMESRSGGTAALNISAPAGHTARLSLSTATGGYTLQTDGAVLSVQAPSASTVLTLDSTGNAQLSGGIVAASGSFAQGVTSAGRVLVQSDTNPQVSVQSTAAAAATVSVVGGAEQPAVLLLQSASQRPYYLQAARSGDLTLGNSSTPFLTVRPDGLLRAELQMTAATLSVQGLASVSSLLVASHGNQSHGGCTT